MYCVQAFYRRSIHIDEGVYSFWIVFSELIHVYQVISQSSSTTVLAVNSRLPVLLSGAQLLPSIQVVSRNEMPPSSCTMPSDEGAECVLCNEGRLVTVTHSSSRSSVYFRVVFHGSSCGPWLLVAPPIVQTFADAATRDGEDSSLRISFAKYAALLLLPAPGPVLSSVTVDRRSFHTIRDLRFPSLVAAAAAMADYPAASAFALFQTPLLPNLEENVSAQVLRSRVVVETNRPPLLPGHVAWQLSSNVAVIPESEIRNCPFCSQSRLMLFLGDLGFVQIKFFTDNVIASFVSIVLSLPAPPLCTVLPSVISVQGGNRLEQNILLKNCQAKGNSTLFFSCGGCAAETLRLTIVCP